MTTALALLPDLHTGDAAAAEYLERLVTNTLNSKHSRRVYGRALHEFLAWYRAVPRGPLGKALVDEYRSRLVTADLSASTINVHLSATAGWPPRRPRPASLPRKSLGPCSALRA